MNALKPGEVGVIYLAGDIYTKRLRIWVLTSFRWMNIGSIYVLCEQLLALAKVGNAYLSPISNSDRLNAPEFNCSRTSASNIDFFGLFRRNNDRGKRIWENADLFKDFFSAKFQKAISRHEIIVVNCEKSIFYSECSRSRSRK
jgi:hypothetical protein